MINQIELDCASMAVINKALLTCANQKEELLYHAWFHLNSMQEVTTQQSLDLWRHLRLIAKATDSEKLDAIASPVGMEEVRSVVTSSKEVFDRNTYDFWSRVNESRRRMASLVEQLRASRPANKERK